DSVAALTNVSSTSSVGDRCVIVRETGPARNVDPLPVWAHIKRERVVRPVRGAVIDRNPLLPTVTRVQRDGYVVREPVSAGTCDEDAGPIRADTKRVRVESGDRASVPSAARESCVVGNR